MIKILIITFIFIPIYAIGSELNISINSYSDAQSYIQAAYNLGSEEVLGLKRDKEKSKTICKQ